MADMSVGRVVAIAVLVGCGVLSYQAWKNGTLTLETERMAKQHACTDPACNVVDDRPRLGQADVIRHRYEFMTTQGLKTVTCKRAMFLFGDWSCETRDGRITADPW